MTTSPELIDETGVTESVTPATTPQNWFRQLTVADGLYLLIVAMAAVIRLVGLGQLPLSPTEAGSALAIWQAGQPEAMSTAVGSAAYFTLTLPFTQIAGYSDAIMRLIPALFGIGLVFLPWFLRRRLGHIGAFVTSLLLAVSPLATILARTAGGDAIALFALLFVAAAWVRFQETGQVSWFYSLFIGLGLGFASAALFYGGLATLIFAIWFQAKVGPRLSAIDPFTMLSPSEWRTAFMIGGGTLIGVSTLLLWYLAGLGVTAQLLADWLAQFTIQANVQTLLNPILIVGRYEWFLLLTAPGLIAWAWWRDKPLAIFFSFWFLGIVALILLQHGVRMNAALIILPGYLLVGLFYQDVLTRHSSQVMLLLTGVLLVLGMLIFVNVARYGRVITYTPGDFRHLWLVALAFAFALASIFFVSTWDRTAAFQATLISVLAVFLFFQWGTGWWLGHYGANDPRERWVTLPATDDDVRVLTTTLQEIARQATSSDSDLSIFSLVDTPILRWYLRHYEHLQIGQTITAGSQYDIIISSEEMNEAALGNHYTGSDFGLLHHSVQAQPGQLLALDILRWWLFHESNDLVNRDQVILWVRSDLVQ